MADGQGNLDDDLGIRMILLAAPQSTEVCLVQMGVLINMVTAYPGLIQEFTKGFGKMAFI